MLIPGDSRVQGGGRTSLLVERNLCCASMLVEKYSILASSFMEERVKSDGKGRRSFLFGFR